MQERVYELPDYDPSCKTLGDSSPEFFPGSSLQVCLCSWLEEQLSLTKVGRIKLTTQTRS